MKAVIDRFEDGYAVLLCGSDEIPLDVPEQLLPAGAVEGDWLNVRLEPDRDETAKRRERMEALLEKLKRKKR